MSPYWASLESTLSSHFGVETGRSNSCLVPFTKIFAALRHDEFIEGVPKFMNHRETYSNILLIKAAIIISQKKFLTLKKIREGVYAWNQICRQENCSNLPIDFELLNNALMLVNLTMSELLMKKWFELMKPYLECENENRKKFDTLVRQIFLRQKQQQRAKVFAVGQGRTSETALLSVTQNSTATHNYHGQMGALLGVDAS